MASILLSLGCVKRGSYILSRNIHVYIRYVFKIYLYLLNSKHLHVILYNNYGVLIITIPGANFLFETTDNKYRCDVTSDY